MNTIRTVLCIWFFSAFVVMPSALALQAASEEGTVIGHLTQVEGNVLRYVAGADDWVQLVKDSPVGIEDLLFCEEGSKAEIIIPNNTWIRTGSTTRLHIINLADDTTELELESGLARFYNKSSVAVIKASTPFGSVMAPPLTVFDLSLQDDTVQVTALAGTVTFNYLRDNSNHEVKAGSASLLADYETISAGAGTTDEAWNAWNREMDEQWEERLQDDGEEHHYLPDTIRHESYALRENGIWETVYYEGSNCCFWRPLNVSSYWSPYTAGRWTVWYGDQCWIPYEPFGYVTHHYGNWIYIDSCSRWYWAPPDCHRRHGSAYYPGIPFAWYPGRVAWIHRGDYVGWIPLAPFEPYYCYRNWGPLSRVVAKDPRRHHKDLDIKDCRFKNHAVIVKKSTIYRGTDYSHERINNRATAFIESFRREAGINNRVIPDLKTMKQRFAFDTRNAKKLQRSTAGKPLVRIKSDDNFLAKEKPPIQKITVQPERSKAPQQPIRTLPVRTKKSSDIQIIRGTAVSTFKPIQRFKPDITMPETRTKLPITLERRQRIGIPGGEQRQVLPKLNRQRPSTGSGLILQNREAPGTPNVQRHDRTPRLQVERPAPYANKGSVNRSYLAPKSTGFGRR